MRPGEDNLPEDAVNLGVLLKAMKKPRSCGRAEALLIVSAFLTCLAGGPPCGWKMNLAPPTPERGAHVAPAGAATAAVFSAQECQRHAGAACAPQESAYGTERAKPALRPKGSYWYR
jgi:hypothetical protein